MYNAITVDVEEWFQVTRLRSRIRPMDWPRQQSRIVENVARILMLFQEYQIKATFFVVGWIAERYPELVRTIYEHGHEIGSHGYQHQLVYEQSPGEFARDLRKSLDLLEKITNEKVISYRAPSFSINNRTLWAFEILKENNIDIDSSLFPVKHNIYGQLPCPFGFFKIQITNKGFLTECPIATLSILGRRFPIGGGGHLRVYPLRLIEEGIRSLNAKGTPAVIYFHPWELDPFFPKVATSLISTAIHYHDLANTENKIRKLLDKFKFTSLRELVSLAEVNDYWPSW